MSSNLTLDVDQAGEFKAALRRADWTNADLKKLCESELLVGLLAVLNNLADIVMKPILVLFSTFELPARTEKLVVAEEFVVGKHGIKYVDLKFNRRFGKKVEGLSEGGMFTAHTLTRGASVAEMATECGPKSTTLLGDLLSQMDKQSDCTEGPLLVNGWDNLVEVEDAEGNKFAVYVHWSVAYGGWDVGEYSLEHVWLAGNRFISRPKKAA